MPTQFEPYAIESKKSEFSAWEYDGDKHEQPPEINEEELLINECDAIKQEAFDKGYAEGMQKAQAEIDEKKAELIHWIEFMQKPIQLLDKELTQEIIQTFIWLSQYCIGVELSVNPDKLHDLLAAVKDELPSLKANKILSMHPEDADWVKANITEQEIPGIEKSLIADPSLNRGDFYLKDDHSELDGRLHTRLSTLFEKYIDKDTIITPISTQD